MLFFLLFLLCALVALGFYWFGGDDMELPHLGINLAVPAVVLLIAAIVVYYQDTGDTETWSGRVTAKKSLRVDCEHSYQCNCVNICSTDSKGNTSYTEICQTCYEHDYDVDWRVYTDYGTVQKDFNIHRIDRQGLREPPRWDAVRVGEPVVRTHQYRNYVKAAPDSLFSKANDEDKSFAATLPAYPHEVYDYYRMNRVVVIGQTLLDPAALNLELNEVNSDLGARKQANMVLVLVSGQPREWFFALQRAWLGGKKNDIVVVIGYDADGRQRQWVDVMAWSQDDMVKVKLRDDLLALTPDTDGGMVVADGDPLPTIKADVDTYFVRKPMADFKYLEASITPTSTQLTVSLIISLLVTVGVGIALVKREELF